MHLEAEHPSKYLTADEVIDHDSVEVRTLTDELRASSDGDLEYARLAFEWVRDEVAHSLDAQDPRVTISASDTLTQRVGLCYAKAHLLTALLRAEGIPTGLCYQRLTDDGETFMLHGLVAVHLDGDWHRQDPRGNKPGVDAQFRIDTEQLAWPVDEAAGERDHPTVFIHPRPSVIHALAESTDVLDLARRGLPDRL